MTGIKRRVRIAEHGQIALPADLLRKHHLTVGDEVSVEDTGLGMLITPGGHEEPMTPEDEATLFATPSPEEIARRQALFAQVMARRNERDISPDTSAEFLYRARTEEGRMDDPGS